MGGIILGTFLVMMFLGVPIAFALGLAGALGIYLSPGGSDLLLVMPQEIFRILSSFPLLTIPLFIFAGTIMAGSGLGKRLIDLAQISVGRMPGGLGAAIVLASMFFSGVSGSATADTAAIGRVTIPALKNQGYPLPFGTALLAAAGGTAMLIPPSIDLIIIGIVANMSIAGLFAAGLVPAVINGLALMALVGYVSWRRKYGFHTAVTLREALRVIVSAIPALVMIVIILGGILSGVFTPTESSAVAVIYALFVAFFVYRDLELSQIPEILRGTLELTGMVLLVIAMGAILSYALTFNRIPHELAAALPAFTDSKIVFLLLVQITFFLIGIVMDGTPALPDPGADTDTHRRQYLRHRAHPLRYSRRGQRRPRPRDAAGGPVPLCGLRGVAAAPGVGHQAASPHDRGAGGDDAVHYLRGGVRHDAASLAGSGRALRPPFKRMEERSHG